MTVTEYRNLSKPKKRKQNPEYNIQVDFVAKMADKYPDVMVFSDTAAHIHKTQLQQIRANGAERQTFAGRF